MDQNLYTILRRKFKKKIPARGTAHSPDPSHMEGETILHPLPLGASILAPWEPAPHIQIASDAPGPGVDQRLD